MSTLASLGFLTAGCGVSTQQEVDMGAQYASQINSQLPIIRDAEINRYITVLGDSLARVAGRTDIQDWQFYVVNSPEVNAFAVPGGFIYMNRGLIERAQNMSQVAGVLGHEIGHVVERHSIEQMQKAQGANIGLTLGCILAPSVCQNQAAGALINVGGNAVFARFSRSDESEADEVGVNIVTRAGIDPRGIPGMFRVLLEERNSRPAGVEAWFSTHPLEEDRIQRTEAQIAQISPQVLQSLTRDTQGFRQFQSRLRSLPQATQAAR
ncbi:M48 family metallopeptidase [Roseisolibacter sp. H3M3-2]|nr:M48 family metallopeptidase [Roseisolibacter sp. H3M3-2]